MTNLNNFAVSQQPPYTKYTLSRIIANKSDDLLDMEVPADFSNTLLENNIEINLYSIADNSLIFSDFIKNGSNTPFYTEILQYADGTRRNLLYIDFGKMNSEIPLPSGRYLVTLNFFTNEVGSYDSRILKVNKISTSRTEVELVLTNKSEKTKLEKFANISIPAEYIKNVFIQIFNQEGAGDLVMPVSPAKIDSSSLYQNFSSGSGELLLTYNFDDDGPNGQPGINTITQNVLNIAYPIALQTATNLTIVSKSMSFTETELSNIVVDAIDQAYDIALEDEKQNPQNYRFDLI